MPPDDGSSRGRRPAPELDGLPGGRGLNIAHEAVDRHAARAAGDTLALRWLGKNGGTRETSPTATLRETRTASPTCSARLGVAKGDRVFALLPRIPELYVACLGTLKNGSVFSPLFSAFGPEPIAARDRARAKARCS